MNAARLLTCAFATTAAALAASPAYAAGSTEVRVAGSTLSVTASGPQQNDVHVFIINGDYVVTDFAATVVATGGGCVVHDPHNVICPPAGVTWVVIDTDGGDDHLVGALHVQNELHGGAGVDELVGADSIDILDGGPGADRLSGRGGQDMADYRTRTRSVGVTLNGIVNDGEPGENDEIDSDIEGVIGGDGDDTLSGSNFRGDRLVGGPGDDSLWGAGGGDVLIGGPDDDDLNGGDGSDTFEADATGDGVDTFNGGAGTWDTVSYAQRASGVTVEIDGVANDGAPGEGDNVATDVENLTGGSAGDGLRGDGDPNQILGGGGGDTLNGRGGDDYLQGGDANDILWGGDGVDNLNGGPGTDWLMGEAGNDTLFGRDFVAGNDHLFGGADSDACTADAGDSKTDCER